MSLKIEFSDECDSLSIGYVLGRLAGSAVRLVLENGDVIEGTLVDTNEDEVVIGPLFNKHSRVGGRQIFTVPQIAKVVYL